jgi:hypothetical protein
MWKLAHRSGPRLIDLPCPIDIASIASICSRSYAEGCELRHRQGGESTPPLHRETKACSTPNSAGVAVAEVDRGV